MNTLLRWASAGLVSCALGISVFSPAQAEMAKAPAVAQTDMSHYRGKWLEIGRTPMWLTDGCVAGYSIYKPVPRPARCWSKMDAAKDRRPESSRRSRYWNDNGRENDQGEDAGSLSALHHLQLLGALQFAGQDVVYQRNADMENLWIYSRSVPSKAKLAVMVRKQRNSATIPRSSSFPSFDVANCGAALHCSLG